MFAFQQPPLAVLRQL